MKNIIRSAFAVMATAFLLALSFAPGSGQPGVISPFGLTAPVSAPAQQQVDPVQLYHDAWKVIDDNFLYRDRLKNWASWEHKFDSQIKNEADAVSCINKMLDSLGEDYTYYKSPTVVGNDRNRSQAKNVVTYQMLPGNIGYIQIRTFSSENTADEVEKALKALSGAKAYILDLRDNGGGLIWQSFEVFSMFVDSGTFTSLKGYYDGKPYNEEYRVNTGDLENIENGQSTKKSRRANLTGGKPVTVLVNGDTASASEMLSGALRDSGRATIIGTKTFGKGIAQITPELANHGAVRVTFAQYFFPKGGSIHGVGLVPDRVVPRSSSGDAQVREALDVIDQNLKK